MTTRILTKLSPSERHLLLGEITYVLMSSNLHRKYLIDDIGLVFLPALDLNQFRIYKVRQEPVALITWAFMSKEIESKFLTGDYTLHPDEWKSGDQAWVIDFLAPFGHAKEVIRDLKNNIFPNQTGKAIRVDENGNEKGVYRLHGRNVAKAYKTNKSKN
tara:strand:+ start:411 stop:887 length:477 start_codon:yes stop_codon:yes gene_type:complete